MGSINKDQVWILSIDGGGIRGLIPAVILDNLEKELSTKLNKDVRIADIFDMVAGTSTGSIFSLGLTVSNEETNRPKYRASDLVKIYKEDGNKVFKKSCFFATHVKGFEKLLKSKFGDKTLKDALRDVLIPAYNITEAKVAYFTKDSDSYSIKDVILASSAAPGFFPAKKIDNNLYIDGGIYMNDPAFEAYLEAKKKFPQAKKIVVCSLGTGYFQGTLKDLASGRSIHWAAPLVSCMINAASNLVGSYLENLKTEQDFKYYRLQCDLKEEIPLFDTKPESLEKLECYAYNIMEGTEFKNLVNEIIEYQKS